MERTGGRTEICQIVEGAPALRKRRSFRLKENAKSLVMESFPSDDGSGEASTRYAFQGARALVGPPGGMKAAPIPGSNSNWRRDAKIRSGCTARISAVRSPVISSTGRRPIPWDGWPSMRRRWFSRIPSRVSSAPSRAGFRKASEFCRRSTTHFRSAIYVFPCAEKSTWKTKKLITNQIS